MLNYVSCNQLWSQYISAIVCVQPLVKHQIETTFHELKYLPMKRHAYFSGKIAIETFPLSFDRVVILSKIQNSRGRALTQVWMRSGYKRHKVCHKVVPRLSL